MITDLNVCYTAHDEGEKEADAHNDAIPNADGECRCRSHFVYICRRNWTAQKTKKAVKKQESGKTW